MDWIEKLAREHGTGGWQTLDDMVRFGNAVAAAEREACAHVCDQGLHQVRENGWIDAANERARCAAAIRARFNVRHGERIDMTTTVISAGPRRRVLDETMAEMQSDFVAGVVFSAAQIIQAHGAITAAECLLGTTVKPTDDLSHCSEHDLAILRGSIHDWADVPVGV